MCIASSRFSAKLCLENSAKHITVPSTEKLCLAKIGYQPNCYVMYIASSWFSAQFCSEDKFTKQYFLLSSFIGPSCIEVAMFSGFTAMITIYREYKTCKWIETNLKE